MYNATISTRSGSVTDYLVGAVAAAVVTLSASAIVAVAIGAYGWSATAVAAMGVVASALVAVVVFGSYARPRAGLTAGIIMIVSGVLWSVIAPAQLAYVTSLGTLLSYGTSTLAVQVIGAALVGLSVARIRDRRRVS